MIRKRGTHYHYEFMLARVRHYGALDGRDGQRVPRSKSEAREIESEIRRNIREGKQSTDKQTFAAFFDNTFLPYSKAHKRSWKHDEFRGEVLKQFFGEKTFSEVTPMVVTQFVNVRLKSKTKRGTTRSGVTVHKEVRLLSSVFNMAIGEGVATTANPCTALPKSVKQKLPARNKRDRFLSDEEEARLFSTLRGRRAHLFPLVRFALETGLRRGEVFRLGVDHVNLSEIVKFAEVDGRSVEIRPGELLVTRGKNGKPRTVPLSPRARAIAVAQIEDVTTSDYLFTGRRTKGMIGEIKSGFCAAVVEAGLRDFRFHDLRHTFATRLNAAGVDPYTIRDLLGHSTTTMSADYTHTSPEGRRAAIEKLDQRTIASFPNSGRITATG